MYEQKQTERSSQNLKMKTSKDFKNIILKKNPVRSKSKIRIFGENVYILYNQDGINDMFSHEFSLQTEGTHKGSKTG